MGLQIGVVFARSDCLPDKIHRDTGCCGGNQKVTNLMKITRSITTQHDNPKKRDFSQQLYRYAEDLRLLIDDHEKLKAEYQHLVGKQAALDQKDDALQQVLLDNRNLYIATDSWGRVQHANPAAVAFFGVTNPVGTHITRLLPADLVLGADQFSDRIHPEVIPGLVQLSDQANQSRHFRLRVVSREDAETGQELLHWLFFPETNELQKDMSWTLATTVFISANEGILVLDRDGNQLAVNPALVQMSGFDSDNLIGQPMSLLLEPETPLKNHQSLWDKLQQSDQWQGRIHLHHKSGKTTVAWLAVSVSRNQLDEVDSYIGLVSDLSPILKVEQHLSHVANYDGLTGLPNRNLLHNRLDIALALARRRNESLTLMFIDLDGFKAVNDQHGHEVGDKVLIEFANRMGGMIREADTFARYGGDEFVLILDGQMDKSYLQVFTGKIIREVSRPMSFDGKQVSIGMSIGCALFPLHAEDGASLIQLADTAMYIAKAAGGNQIVLYGESDNRINRGARARCDLKHALERHYLHMVYQPVFDLSKEHPRLVGAEALLRCMSRQGKTMSPEGLVHQAEKNGLILPLNQVVMHSACEQMARWYEQGMKGIRLTVNLSLEQVLDHHFIEEVMQAVECFERAGDGSDGVPLDFDIKGFDALTAGEGRRELVKLLRQLGIRLGIEDVANERFSLNSLARAPISRLKVGASTLASMSMSDEGVAQCESVAALGRVMDLEPVAVGIENPDQLSQLRRMGYQYGQGFLFGRPVSATDFYQLYGRD